MQAGADYAEAVLRRLQETLVENEIVFEFFDLPPVAFLHSIDASVRHWSMEISPESHDAEVRRAQEGESVYDNQQFEQLLHEALRLRCTRLDVFFMIGLPRQTRRSVQDTVAYCERLFQRSDRRLSCFISPMGPFLDPGSRVFEEPEKFGYRLFARSLEEHRRLLLQRSWEQILNYETEWMNRAELVEATYDAGEALNRAKMRYGRISMARGKAVARRIQAARDLRARLAANQNQHGEAQRILEGEIAKFSASTVCDRRELFWPRHLINFKVREILAILYRSYSADRR